MLLVVEAVEFGLEHPAMVDLGVAGYHSQKALLDQTVLLLLLLSITWGLEVLVLAHRVMYRAGLQKQQVVQE